MTKQLYYKVITVALVIAVVICGGGFYLYKYITTPPLYKTAEESDVYVRFDMEAYDSVIKNYWEQVTEENLASRFESSLQQAVNTSNTPLLSTTTRAGVARMLWNSFKTATSTDIKKQLARDTLIVVLRNLRPIGRNDLYSQVQETQLRQTVSNVNPSADLYKNLGLKKGASTEEVAEAYKEKEATLKTATSTEAKKELAEAVHAKAVLTDPNTKMLYDEAKIEPTVWSSKMGSTLYFSVSKISPTTLQEFGRIIDNASTTEKLDSLIIDLRGNIGGSLDFPQSFLGLFIGTNQFAFNLFHQGNYEAQRTVTSKWNRLSRYKEIAFLTDRMTQSTAELTAATFKRLHLGVVVGEPTRGWGSVENTFPLQTVIDPKEKYSLFLVHRLTLRDDNQPIEQNGVDPDIDTRKPNWWKELPKFFRSESLTAVVAQAISKPPLRK